MNKNIINIEDDLGEVGEWVDHRANIYNNKDDDEFDVFDTEIKK